MQSLTHLGTFEALIENADESIAAIAVAARDLIQELHPDAVEVPRIGEKSATYGLGPKKMSEAYAFISVHKAHVNLGFFYGTRLDDPTSLLEGTGTNIRHIKLKHLDDLKAPAIRTLVEKSIAERKETLNQ